jgi:hypothetical protein
LGWGRPQIQGRARALSWAVATWVAQAISSGSAKDCPARAVLRKIRHQPSSGNPGALPRRGPLRTGRALYRFKNVVMVSGLRVSVAGYAVGFQNCATSCDLGF